MKITKKHSPRFSRVVGKCVVLGALALAVTGCVAETSPRGYYGTYPNDYSYYNTAPGSTIVAQPGTTVIIHDNPPAYDDGSDHDYDNHWDYGRRGNGNFHGTGDDDVHDD